VKDLKYLKMILPALDKDMQKKAQTVAAGKLVVDLFTLESLINPDKFDFPKEEIGTVGVEVDE